VPLFGEAKTGQVAAGVVVVEGAAGHAGDADCLEDVHDAFFVVGPGHAGDVGKHVVRALGNVGGKPGAVQRGAERVALDAMVLNDRVIVVVAKLNQPACRPELERGGRLWGLDLIAALAYGVSCSARSARSIAIRSSGMRPVTFERHYVKHPAGSCLAVFGDTKVICTASISSDLPPFLRNSGKGWVTAEYAMLPGSTGGGRKRRDGVKQDGRGTEIQRLIGRCLRSAVDMAKLGEVAITIDCDVLQADGGTRTAAISGGWVALYDALRVVATQQDKPGPEYYLLGQVSAVSVGIVNGEVICDLDYANDSTAEVDMNVVMRDAALVEVQGTGEQGVFSRAQLSTLIDAAEAGCSTIRQAQLEALAAD